MIKNYIKMALRIMKKQKGHSFINILGLAVGMAVSILIFLWVQDELNYDTFNRNFNELHLVGQRINYNNRQLAIPVTPAALAPALKNDFPEISNAARYYRSGKVLFSYGEKNIYEDKGAYVDGSFLEMFSFLLVKGDIKTAFSDPYSIIITEELAEKYFVGKNPLGKTLKLRGAHDFVVRGVLKNIPHNSSLQFNYLIPFKFLKKLEFDLNNWDNNFYLTFILIRKDMKYQEVEQKIFQRLKKENPDSKSELFLHPLERMHLHSTMWGWGGSIQYVRFFLLVAFFILFIACINFLNLSSARSLKRSKEVGLRKVVGANRVQLIKQFLGESLLMTLLALLLAILLAQLFLPTFNELTGKHLKTGIFSSNIGIVFIAIALLTTLLSSFYPALLLSSFRPVNVLKGMVRAGKKSLLFRNILVVIQFAISIGLIISTLVIFNQLNYMKNKKLGFEKENVLYLSLEGIEKQYESIKGELLKDSSVLSVACSSHSPTNITSSTANWDWEGKNPDEKVMMGIASFGFDYAKTFNLEMAMGRFYSEEFATDTSDSVVINEEALRVMGIESPLRKRLSYGKHNYTIIGVVKNFHFMPLHKKIQPIVLLSDPDWKNYMFVKVNPGNVSQALSHVEQVYKKFNPGYPYEYKFLDDDFRHLYRAEREMGELFKYFVIFAIFISCMGLFALASFMTERKTKEIGIRKVLGASESSIVVLFCRKFSKWVLVGNVIAWPIAYYAMSNWLQGFAYRISLGFEIFIFSALLVLVIALLTTGYHSIKSALTNPVNALRYE